MDLLPGQFQGTVHGEIRRSGCLLMVLALRTNRMQLRRWRLRQQRKHMNALYGVRSVVLGIYNFLVNRNPYVPCLFTGGCPRLVQVPFKMKRSQRVTPIRQETGTEGSQVPWTSLLSKEN